MKRLLFSLITLALMLFALASCFGENHEYSGPCDPSCNTCDRVTRETEVEHTFKDCNDTDCDVCGEVREPVAHTYKSECDESCDVCGEKRTVNTDLHFYEGSCDTDCNFCGAQRVASDHIYTTDCDTDCNFCGAQRVTTHTYSNACDKDCNVCGAYRIPAQHVYANACDASCEVCGALRTVSNHVYSSVCDGDCNICGEKRSAQPHVYDHGCDTDCNFCGEERTVGEHVYDYACDQSCNICGAVRENVHSFGAWHTKTAATCVTPEIIARSCSVCGEEETADSGEPLGHDFTNDCDIACNRAKCNFIRDDIEHAFGEWTTKIAATCTTNEVEQRICTVCGESETRTGDVAATGHVYDDACDVVCNVPGCDFPRKAPHVYDDIEDLVCNECGQERGCTGHKPWEKDCTICYVCGETVAEWSHSFGELVTKSEANCTEPEWLHKICSVCGVTTEPVKGEDALDHDWDNACDTECNRTGCGFTRTITHAYEWVLRDEATCEAEAIEHQVCDVCDDIGESRAIEGSMLPHSYADKCTIVCSLCEKNTRTIEEAEHVYSDNTDVSCNECGYVRPCPGHEAKDDDCMTCRFCNTTIPGASHSYDNACDTECNECGSVRTVAPHSHGGIDCTICQHCGAATGIAHVATATDCTVCQNCQAGTGNHHVASEDDCAKCGNGTCQQASGVAHTPSDTNCTKCTECHKDTGIDHKDDNSDQKCDECETPVLPESGWFPWAPL